MKRQATSESSRKAKRAKQRFDGELPGDIIAMIMKMTSPRAFCRTRQGCKRYNALGAEFVLEKKIYHARHGSLVPLNMAIKMRDVGTIVELVRQGEKINDKTVDSLLRYGTLACVKALIKCRVGRIVPYYRSLDDAETQMMASSKAVHELLCVEKLNMHIHKPNMKELELAVEHEFKPSYFIEAYLLRPHVKFVEEYSVFQLACKYNNLELLEYMCKYVRMNQSEKHAFRLARTLEQFKLMEVHYGTPTLSALSMASPLILEIFDYCLSRTPVLTGGEAEDYANNWRCDYVDYVEINTVYRQHPVAAEMIQPARKAAILTLMNDYGQRPPMDKILSDIDRDRLYDRSRSPFDR